jgi:hypothetical protein
MTHSDPGGWFPEWLANLLVSRTPKTMFARLQKALDREEVAILMTASIKPGRPG